MKKLVVHYRDKEMSPKDVFTAGPYHPNVARKVADTLGQMNCYDFTFEVVKEAA